MIHISGKYKDLTGQRFGKLVVIKEIGITEKNQVIWLCKCDCGNEKSTQTRYLTSKHTRSCGCFYNHAFTHGHTHTKFYQVWNGMKKRCSPVAGHKNYNGRGIKVCERWQSYENFYADMHQTYTHGLTIERINNDGDYEPSNCKWATRKEQARNRRQNRMITIQGRTLCLEDWCIEYGMLPMTVSARISNGMNPLEALTKPRKQGIKIPKEKPYHESKEFEL